MSFFSELRRRSVFRIAAAYVAVSWLVIQVFETLLPVFDVSEAVLRWIVILIAIGFVPVVISAWAFELTPEGVRRDAEVDHASPSSRRLRKQLDRLIMVILAVALGFFAADKFVIDPARDRARELEIADRARQEGREEARTPLHGKTSVAVLPFDNLSDDPNQEHFADGLTEELLNALAAIRELRVTSRTSSFQFRDPDQSIREIAAELGVGHILEGSIRRAGDRLRITAQLIETSSDSHLWSNSYDRELTVDNVLEIQEEIARMVTGALQVELLPQAAAVLSTGNPANLDALDHFHDGMYVLRQIEIGQKFGEITLESATESFLAAIEADPLWAAPQDAIGRVYLFFKHDGDPDSNLRTGIEYVEEAIRLDPNYGPAWATLGYARMVEGEIESASRAYDRALDLGADVPWARAIFLKYTGRYDEAIDQYHEAILKDPLSYHIRMQLTEALYCAARYDEAAERLSQFLTDNPERIYAGILLADSYVRMGDFESGLRIAEDLVVRTGKDIPGAVVFALAGQTQRATAAMNSVDSSEPFLLMDVAPVAVVLGNEDLALDLLEQAFASADSMSSRYTRIWRMQCQPEIRSLADNPRYQALVAGPGQRN